jgi:hypothetical protein
MTQLRMAIGGGSRPCRRGHTGCGDDKRGERHVRRLGESGRHHAQSWGYATRHRQHVYRPLAVHILQDRNYSFQYYLP